MKGEAPKLMAPSAEVHGLNGKLGLPGVKGDLAAPSVNGELPQMHLKGSTSELSVGDKGKFTMPTMGMTGTNLRATNLDGSVSTPTLTLPEAEAALKTPELPFTTPKFQMPKFQGSSLDIEHNAPDVDVSLAKAELKGPNVSAELPDADIEGASKVKWPKFRKPKGRVKGPVGDSNVDLSPPDLSVAAPKVDADINAPSVDIDGPDVDLNAPKLNADAPSGKYKFPTFRLPKFNRSKLEGPNVDGDIKTPVMDMDMNIPHAKLEGPTIDAKAPDLKLLAPKVEGDIGTPDLNLRTPDLDLKAPKIEAEASGIKFKRPKMPKFTTPGAKIKGPHVDADLNVPDVDVNGDGNLKPPTIDAPSAKLKRPHLKMPKFSLTGPRVKAPNVDANLQTPDVDMDLPSGELKGSNLDLKAPRIDGSIAVPDVEFPKAELKNSNLSLHAESPDLNLTAADVDLNLLKGELEGPDVDLNAPNVDAPSGKLKMPHFKMPRFNLSGPKVKGPNVDSDLNAPNMDLDLPKADLTGPDLNVKAPKVHLASPDVDLNLPKGSVQDPDVDLKVPDANINAPSGKLKMPHFKMPKFNLSGPKFSGPNVDADLNAPHMDLDLPKADLKGPDLNVKAPKVQLSSPDVDLNLPKGSVQSPDVGLKVPDASINAPSETFKMPNLKFPKFNVSGPNLNKPDLHAELEASLPKVDGGLNKPDIDLNPEVSAPAVDVKLPKADVKVPEVDVKTPEIEPPSGKFKLFTFKKHKTGTWSPKVKTPETEVNASVKQPDLSLSAPTTEADVKAPKAGVNLPSAGPRAPSIELDAPKGKTIKFPTLKHFHFSGPKVKAPDFDEPDVSLLAPKVESPNLDLNLPGGEGDAEVSADADVKLPKNLPMFKTHRLPNSRFEDLLQEGTEAVHLNTPTVFTSTPTADPQSETFSLSSVPRIKAGWKSSTGTLDSNGHTPSIDIKERLRLFAARSTSDLTEPNVDLPDSSFRVKRGTFRVSSPDTNKEPLVNSSSEEKKLSLSLNNMLGLSNHSDAED